jgi:hypothetical protein
MTAVHAEKESRMNRREVLSSATLMAAGIAGSQVISAGANAGTDDEQKTPSRNVNEAVVRYLAAWNERGAHQRRGRSGLGTWVRLLRLATVECRVVRRPAHSPDINSPCQRDRAIRICRFSWMLVAQAPLYIRDDVAVPPKWAMRSSSASRCGAGADEHPDGGGAGV